MSIKRSLAIRNFLISSTHPDLASLYYDGMEVQVNVAQDDGERLDASDSGTRTIRYTDGVQSWSSFRVPRKAMSEPEDNDYVINWELDKHAEAIGMTGWDWKKRVSKWVAFDFDSITGHSANHASTLSEAELEKVKDEASKIPWVTVRKSTGGRGLHLYVFVNDVPTANHNEHAALARAILGLMSAIAGYDFADSVDACGGNIWVWGRKMIGTDGLSLIKKGETLIDVPINWQDHIKVTRSRGKTRNLPQFIPESEVSLFEQLAGQRPRVPLDPEHKKLIDYLTEKKALWWWDQDYHMLVCCTHDLKCAFTDLRMRGVFDTAASGKDGEQNAFAFPARHGSWVVRRYSKGVSETPNWDQDANGYTRCYLNRDPDLSIAARTFGGVEQEKGGFDFRSADVAKSAAKILGADFSLPENLATRRASLKAHKDGRLIVKVNRETGDNPDLMAGWKDDKSVWTRIFNLNVTGAQNEPDTNSDDLVRHLITESGQDAGWVIRSDTGTWTTEPIAHVKAALGTTLGAKAAQETIGTCVVRPWRLVNRPFKPEYPGDRQWNRNSAQLRFAPSPEPGNFPTWSKVFEHVGASLDEAIKVDSWCQAVGIKSGHDYLVYWAAFLFREPMKKLPYLFFYGPQNSGKSSFHMALSLLFDRKRGFMRADAALTSQGGFNGELANIVLAVIEETDLSKQSSSVYNKIKDWVTSLDFLVHEKYVTPYMIPNCCHFIQTANSRDFCPIFRDDTRITMSYVPNFEKEIPISEFISNLEKEAPDFLGHLFNLKLPESGKRLALPVINTDDKIEAGKANQTPFEAFLDDKMFRIPGAMVRLGDMFQALCDYVGPNDAPEWSRQKMTSLLPPDLPKGRGPDSAWYIGNISFAKDEPPGPRLIKRGERLVAEDS